MKAKKFAIVLCLVLLLSVIYIDVSTCRVITGGIFAGRTICFLMSVPVIAGETTDIDVEINKTI